MTKAIDEATKKMERPGATSNREVTSYEDRSAGSLNPN